MGLLEPLIVRRLAYVAVFAIAFACVEASVVVYLRDLYYPDGFSFPIRPFDGSRLVIELVREVATMIMLGMVGMIAGDNRWQRFAYFAIAFGLWDVFFYLWLKVMINWPVSLLEWDILFLLPVPWVGPVLAPVLISLALLFGGGMILVIENRLPFHPPVSAWLLASGGSLVVLWTFMKDTDAGLRGMPPAPFSYGVFILGLLMYVTSMTVSWYANRWTKNEINA